MAKTIGASVGLHGKNLSEDTLTVQQLLNGVDQSQGGPDPNLDEDSKCGPKTTAAIQRFQLFHFGWAGADARVDPDGPTLRKLNELNPGPILPPAPVVPPNPAPLSTDFFIWLRMKEHFFPEPLSSKDFVFTLIDVTNNRDMAYVLSFGVPSDIPPFPPTGSGGHMQRFTARKPSTVTGLGGQAVYTTRILPGPGDANQRLRSTFSFFPEAWREGAGISGITVEFDAHLSRPQSNDTGSAMSIPGRFDLL